MFLHNVTSARIEWGDTLNNPLLVENDKLMKFDVVVANMPFSLDKWGADGAEKDKYKRFFRGVPPKGNADYAFISHMIEIMHKTSGRMAVIVPHGVLFRGGGEGKIRQKLIEENLLDAVIGLPANLFFGTSIPAAILIFKRNRLDQRVLFIDSSREFESGTNQNYLRAKDIEKIVSTYRTRKNIDKYAYLADFDEIKENDFNLNISRYIDTFIEEEVIDIRATQKTIAAIETQLSDVKKKMKKYLGELRIND